MPAEAEALLDHARIQANSTLEEARQAVWNLRHPEAAELSITTLFDLARKLGAEHGIQIETEMAGSGSLDPETDRTFLLVAREALRNAVVHAKPGRISVRVHIEPSEAILEVADDGFGFAAEREESGQDRHFGIVGMRERIEKLGGVFSIVSSRGAGTKVVARVPLPGSIRTNLQFDNSATERGNGRGRAVGHVEPGQDDVDVPLHGGLRDPQRLGDLLVAHALYDELQHLQFAAAQFGVRRPLGQGLQNRRRQASQSMVHIADGVEKFVRRHPFEQVSLGARLQRADKYLRLPCRWSG